MGRRRIHEPVKEGSARVYAVSSASNPRLEYVGSTTRAAGVRLGAHVSAYNRYTSGKCSKYCSSFEIIKLGSPTVRVLQEIDNLAAFGGKSALERLEHQFIKAADTRGKDCVNKRTPAIKSTDAGITNLRKTNLRWIENNKAKITARHICECGGRYQSYARQMHTQTKKHERFAENNQAINEIMGVYALFAD